MKIQFTLDGEGINGKKILIALAAIIAVVLCIMAAQPSVSKRQDTAIAAAEARMKAAEARQKPTDKTQLDLNPYEAAIVEAAEALFDKVYAFYGGLGNNSNSHNLLSAIRESILPLRIMADEEFQQFAGGTWEHSYTALGDRAKLTLEHVAFAKALGHKYVAKLLEWFNPRWEAAQKAGPERSMEMIFKPIELPGMPVYEWDAKENWNQPIDGAVVK